MDLNSQALYWAGTCEEGQRGSPRPHSGQEQVGLTQLAASRLSAGRLTAGEEPAQRPRAAASLSSAIAPAQWDMGNSQQQQLQPQTVGSCNEDGELLSTSSVLLPLHVNSIQAAFQQLTTKEAAARSSGPPQRRQRWDGEHFSAQNVPELWRSSPLQALPDTQPPVHPQVAAAAQAARVAVARQRASLDIVLSAGEPSGLGGTPLRDSFALPGQQTAHDLPSWQDGGRTQWADSYNRKNAMGAPSQVACSNGPGDRSTTSPHLLSGRRSAAAPTTAGDRAATMWAATDDSAREAELRRAREESAAQVAETMRLRASHAELQSQLEARRRPSCIGLGLMTPEKRQFQQLHWTLHHRPSGTNQARRLVLYRLTTAHISSSLRLSGAARRRGGYCVGPGSVAATGQGRTRRGCRRRPAAHGAACRAQHGTQQARRLAGEAE